MEPKNEFELDLYNLDKAYLAYPTMTDKYNSNAVEAEIAAQNAKNAMDEKRSFLDQDIRENQSNYGLMGIKLTEGIVTAQINADAELKLLTDKYYKLLSEHKRLKAKCITVHTVGKSLEGLTSLFKAGYFASNPICSMPDLKSNTEKETTAVTPKTKTKLNSLKK